MSYTVLVYHQTTTTYFTIMVVYQYGMSQATLYRPQQTGPNPAQFRLRCPDCGFTQYKDSRARAVTRQKNRACPHCDRMLAVSKVMASSRSFPQGSEGVLEAKRE